MIRSVFVVLSLFLFSGLLHAQSAVQRAKDYKMSVGLNYPGAGIKLLIGDAFLEGRIQSDKDLAVLGVRYYRYLPTNDSIFWGVELNYQTFSGSISDGTGYALEPFVGYELFFAKGLALEFDIGPALIAMSDRNSSTGIFGVEYVFNSGINYYFGRR